MIGLQRQGRMTDIGAMPVCRISLRDVSLTLEDRPVFDRLSLDLTAGRIGLVGRNGAGKSQLLRLIAGLVAPDVGAVAVNGFDPAKDRRRATSEIGFVFQEPEHALLFPTVIEELRFGPASQGRSRPEADRAARGMLAHFGLADWETRLVHSLSHGQKHLLALMAACVGGAGLVLLDEAFAGLDLPTERALQRLLDKLPAAQIQASHDLAALAGCDRVIWLERGLVRGDGPPQRVLPAFRAAMEAAPLAPDAL